MELLDVVKTQMTLMRIDSGWESFFENVKEICAQNGLVDIGEEVHIICHSRQDGFKITNLQTFAATAPRYSLSFLIKSIQSCAIGLMKLLVSC
jgi:hypothetical protein